MIMTAQAHEAAEKGDLDILSAWLARECGVNPMVCGDVLTSAAFCGQEEAVRLLLPHSLIDDVWFCGLAAAAKGGQLAVVQLLLAEMPASAISANRMVLIDAVKGGSEPIVRLLLPHIDPSEFCYQALRTAIQQKNPVLRDLLLPVSDVNLLFSQGITASDWDLVDALAFWVSEEERQHAITAAPKDAPLDITRGLVRSAELSKTLEASVPPGSAPPVSRV